MGVYESAIGAMSQFYAGRVEEFSAELKAAVKH